MKLDALTLSRMVPCSLLTASEWDQHFNAAIERWGIDTPHRVAGFIAQISHESRRLASLEENLNYNPQRLMKVWPTRFTSLELAKRYAYAPEKLANFVYGGRMGNGPFESGDGWRYRGRGAKMLTGADNYRIFGELLGLPLLEDPDLLLKPSVSAQVAGAYWHRAGCNELMDRAPFEAITKARDNDFFELVTRRINGGLIGHEDGNDEGLDDRVELYVNACRVLGISPGA